MQACLKFINLLFLLAVSQSVFACFLDMRTALFALTLHIPGH